MNSIFLSNYYILSLDLIFIHLILLNAINNGIN